MVYRRYKVHTVPGETIPLGDVGVSLATEGVMKGEGLVAKGSGKPLSTSCFLLMIRAATIANVVLTAPTPQLKTRDVRKGSVSRITRRYASR